MLDLAMHEDPPAYAEDHSLLVPMQTYFNDSVEGAKKVVDECLDKWTNLLARLPEDEAQRLQRSMGLKIEQLKAEFENVRKLHLEDH
jgi:hypothetical protein